MKALGVAFVVKIVLTLLLWCLPLMFFPDTLLEGIGLPVGPSILFLRLLGTAYAALIVGYAAGARKALRGEYPSDIVWVGIASNGGAFGWLLIAALGREWAEWGIMARALMWISLGATGAITIALIALGPARRK